MPHKFSWFQYMLTFKYNFKMILLLVDVYGLHFQLLFVAIYRIIKLE
jgi:hypothetical protein